MTLAPGIEAFQIITRISAGNPGKHSNWVNVPVSSAADRFCTIDIEVVRSLATAPELPPSPADEQLCLLPMVLPDVSYDIDVDVIRPLTTAPTK